MVITLDSHSDIENLELNIKGWVNPLKIQYGYVRIHNVIELHWNVIGTKHIFKIPLHIIYEYHKNDLKEAFELALNNFRLDYKEWESVNFSENWMNEYKIEFEKLII